mmetsp:Transcript_33043/g.31481  ORF Transcript_33043/g.31481 Transcript_33043/m.31481 type:complete len:148 (+) Transcript_33043:141-584(+)|eukprot:CAMPEP_0119051030 /NCGR_PEP_ID=MMETSP1177-20130426/72777_1 /TAXON_ID=2985 /ORGANISM="Ochromonas sp, Strain CCMP1899" /LENGTH=147 /DNA_ID=CAMNT_0007030089 /DNA_START=133 /DNA_END=576 /DNA_ORIENTATION=+
MGENASANWAWHNTIVGQGYQAKGVVRQREATTLKVVDYRTAPVNEPLDHTPSAELQIKEKDRKKLKKEKKESYTSEDDKHHNKKSKKGEKATKEKIEKKDHKKHSHSTLKDKHVVINTVKDEFNPLLQYLATTLSNKTRTFTLEND